MPFELVITAFIVATVVFLSFFIWGSVSAVRKLKDTIKVEKLAKSYGLDYNIRNKTAMYVICIAFSWLAYSALCRIENEDTEGERNVKKRED